jgi:hypothetical protein
LATDHGKESYLKRQGSVEPVFGQIKANRGANRFLRRGRSEWRLLTLTRVREQRDYSGSTRGGASARYGSRTADRGRRRIML